jgi:hypothetical protein
MVAVQKPQPMVGIAHFSEFRSHTISSLSTDPGTCEGIATPNSPLPLCVILSEAKNPGAMSAARNTFASDQRWHFGQKKLARCPTATFLIGVEHV